jgi:hypothetical protein
MHNTSKSTAVLNALTFQKSSTRKRQLKPVYSLDCIFTSKGKIEVWYEVFNKECISFIKLTDLAIFAAKEAGHCDTSQFSIACLLKNVYEFAEAYLIQNKAGQNIKASSAN